MSTNNKQPPPAYDVESLAIFLAVGASSDEIRRRPQLLEAWEEKAEQYQQAYRRRARRLMRIWRTP